MYGKTLRNNILWLILERQGMRAVCITRHILVKFGQFDNVPPLNSMQI